jgi:hypothetical protein
VDKPINTSKDPLHVPNGPMTRSKTKALKEAFNALVLNVSTKSELKGPNGPTSLYTSKMIGLLVKITDLTSPFLA